MTSSVGYRLMAYIGGQHVLSKCSQAPFLLLGLGGLEGQLQGCPCPIPNRREVSPRCYGWSQSRSHGALTELLQLGGRESRCGQLIEATGHVGQRSNPMAYQKRGQLLQAGGLEGVPQSLRSGLVTHRPESQ